jgi:hypothetical protein
MRERADREVQDAVLPGLLVDVVGPVAEVTLCDRPTDDRDQDQEDDEDRASDRDLVAPEPSPDLLPVAASANRLLESAFAKLAVRLDGNGPGETRLAADDL